MIVLSLFLYFLWGASASAQETSGIRDIRPPVNFPFNFLPLIILGVLVCVAAIVFALTYFLKKRKIKKPPEPPIVKSAYAIACEALQALLAKNLPSQGRIKEYYIELSDIVRHYMEGSMNIRAPEMTTEEFLSFMRASGALSALHKNLLKEFLVQSDMVKFARYGPAQTEIEESLVRARRFIDETKRHEESV